MIITAKKQLSDFRKKHQTKLLKLEKKINFKEVEEYNALLKEKQILDGTYDIGDWIEWHENEDDGCNGTCQATYCGEITEINLRCQRYEVKMKNGRVRSVSFHPYSTDHYGIYQIVNPSQPEVGLSSVMIRRPFGGE